MLTRLGLPDRSAGEIAIMDSLAACVAGADLVVETVPEKLELKIDVFRQIEAVVGPDCVLASDTSGIPITKIQEGLSLPGRVVGMHWSNPPHIIPMIEVIAGEKTSPEVVRWMVETVKLTGHLPVVIKKDVPGFVENRVLYAVMRECLDLVEQGVIDPEGLDTCVSWGIGYKLAVVGPMALLDMAGLDIYQAVAQLSEQGALGPRRRRRLCDRAHRQEEARHQDRRGDLRLYARTNRRAAGRAGAEADCGPQGPAGLSGGSRRGETSEATNSGGTERGTDRR